MTSPLSRPGPHRKHFPIFLPTNGLSLEARCAFSNTCLKTSRLHLISSPKPLLHAQVSVLLCGGFRNKMPQPGWLHQVYFLTVVEAGAQAQGADRLRSFGDLSPGLAGGRPLPGSPRGLSPVCAHPWCLCDRTPSSCEGIPSDGLSASFSFHHLRKGAVCKYGHVRRPWGLGLQQMGSGRLGLSPAPDTQQPQYVPLLSASLPRLQNERTAEAVPFPVLLCVCPF